MSCFVWLPAPLVSVPGETSSSTLSFFSEFSGISKVTTFFTSGCEQDFSASIFLLSVGGGDSGKFSSDIFSLFSGGL